MDFGRLRAMPPLLVVSSILAVIANSLLLLVFFKRRGLRTISNRFVINLLVTNLLSSLLLVPLLVHDRSSQTADGAVFENSTNSYNISTETITNIVIDEKIVNTPEFIEIDINISENITSTRSTNPNHLMCYFVRTVTNLVCTASIFSILLIGIDQYFAVIHALRYHSYIDKFKSSMLLASCWLFSLTIAALDLVISPDTKFWLCCSHSDDNTNIKLSYSILYFLIVIMLPFCTICIIYFCIYFAARKNSERMRKSTSSATTNLRKLTNNPASYSQLPISKESSSDENLSDIKLPKVQSAPNIVNLEELSENKLNENNSCNNKRVSRTPSDRRNLIITLKTKISNASVFKYREETRAARISILVIFMVLSCYAPYGLAVILSNVIDAPNLNYLSLLLLTLSNTISPFLFAYRNKRIRREFFKFMGLLRKRQASESPVRSPRRRSSADIVDNKHADAVEPFLNEPNFKIPKVVVSCKVESEKQSILKRVYSKTYKKCNFITVPESCLDARGSVSSASTQISTDE